MGSFSRSRPFLSETITPADIDAAIAHDKRVLAAAQGIEVEISMRDGGPLNLVLAALEDDASKAMKEFAEADLGDIRALQELQARVYRFHVAYATLQLIRARGVNAEMQVHGEAQRDGGEDEG